MLVSRTIAKVLLDISRVILKQIWQRTTLRLVQWWRTMLALWQSATISLEGTGHEGCLVSNQWQDSLVWPMTSHLKAAQMITEPQGLDDHGCSFAQRRVTQRTDFLATHWPGLQNVDLVTRQPHTQLLYACTHALHVHTHTLHAHTHTQYTQTHHYW